MQLASQVLRKDVHTNNNLLEEIMKRLLVPLTFFFVTAFFGHVLAQEVQPTDNTYGLQVLVDTLVSPVQVIESPDTSGRRFVVDRIGQIWVLAPGDTLLDEPFLDIQDKVVELGEGTEGGVDERGLLSLTFHPEYAENGQFYVYYSAPLRDQADPTWDHTTHISQFTVSEDDSNKADPNSEQIILQVDQPQDNHNGGTVAFGPDSLLYISLGDGGGQADTSDVGHSDDWYEENDGGNGQDISDNLLGSILRIDVDNPEGGLNYGIPDDNPFVETTDTLDEVYAFGLRNPYRISFDMENDTLYAQDAGQHRWEEINLIETGGNYGWNVKEGTECFDAANPMDPQIQECPDEDPRGEPLIDPVVQLKNTNHPDGDGQGLVIVGGYVYRGDSLSAAEINGQYVFGTWSRGYETEAQEEHLGGAVFVAEPQEDTLWTVRQVQFDETTNATNGDLNEFVLGFGQDNSGEMYVLTSQEEGPTGNTGTVYRLVPGAEADAREATTELPERINLKQNYPNPFNPSTNIAFDLNQPGKVSLTVFDVTGRKVVTLVNKTMPAGTHSVQWRGTNAAGIRVSSGLYLYRLRAGDISKTRTMMLVK